MKQEYKVYNLYVFVFDKAGRKEYGHLFELNATNPDDKFFDVHEKENSEGATTSGKIKMKISSGESVYTPWLMYLPETLMPHC